MATLLSLVAAQQLTRLNQPLPPREQPMRTMYLRQEAIDGIRTKVLPAASDRGKDTTPIQELDDFLTEYIAGRSLSFPRSFHALKHVDHAVWELKTVDVRIFGWFHALDTFICTDVDLKKTVITGGGYGRYRDACVAFRRILDLDEPKFITGESPDDVVSNYTVT